LFTTNSNPVVRSADLLGTPFTGLHLRKARGRPKEEYLKNVDMKVEGNILTIRVDLSKEFGPSASGKTIIIASTEGNVSVTDRDEKVGLNVYRKKP
jgi:hypothetical protein